MPQDAFTLQFIARQLNSLLIGGKISKIVQPDKDEVTLIVYTGRTSLKLDINTNAKACRVSISSDDKPNPIIAPNFCMLLRKHLQNAQILDVRQVGFERIIVFDLLCSTDFTSEKMSLYCEIMGKYSNIILVKEGIIVGALKTTSLEVGTARILFTGAKYTLPLPQNKVEPLVLGDLYQAFPYPARDPKEVCDKVKGIALTTATDMFSLYDCVDANAVYDFVNNRTLTPCVVYNMGEPCDFKAITADKNIKSYDSLLSAQSAYYSYLYTKRVYEAKKNYLLHSLNANIKRLIKRLAQIDDKLLECLEGEKLKLYGELLTANIYAVERGMDSFTAYNYYLEDSPPVKIPLDKTLSPSENIQRYYKRYQKLKRTQENLNVQRREAQEKLDYLQSINAHICLSECVIDLEDIEQELIQIGLLKDNKNVKKKRDLSLPFRQYNYNNFTIIAGRNNAQNDRLTKGLSQDDLWLHTQKYHSTHVGIIANGKTIPDEVIVFAAEICAYYSDGREGDKIPVDYTLKKYVKKPPKRALGFVIYTDYKTVLVTPNAHKEYLLEDKNV